MTPYRDSETMENVKINIEKEEVMDNFEILYLLSALSVIHANIDQQ